MEVKSTEEIDGNKPLKLFYTTNEVANLFRVCSKTVYRFSEADSLFPQPFHRRKGGKTLWEVEAVDQYIKDVFDRKVLLPKG